MSEERIAELEGELLACQELLFGVLWSVGEPVEVDVNELRRVIVGQDHMIDAQLNTDEGIVTCSVLKIVEVE